MSRQRSIKRNMIKNHCYKRDGNMKAFKSEWLNYRYIQLDAKIKESDKNKEKIVNTSKKKKRHFSNSKTMIKQMKMMKETFNSMKKTKGQRKVVTAN